MGPPRAIRKNRCQEVLNFSVRVIVHHILCSRWGRRRRTGYRCSIQPVILAWVLTQSVSKHIRKRSNHDRIMNLVSLLFFPELGRILPNRKSSGESTNLFKHFFYVVLSFLLQAVLKKPSAQAMKVQSASRKTKCVSSETASQLANVHLTPYLFLEDAQVRHCS